MSSENKGRFTVSETGVNFKCPNCAGQLRYDIGKKEMLCGQCGSSFSVNRIPDPTGSGNKEKAAEIETIEYHCPSCGASLHTTASGMTSYCVFCGSDTVLEERMTRMRRPDKIVPFTVTREDCERIYRERLRNTPLVPGTMKKAETVSRFRPVYVPFWCLGGSGEGLVPGEFTSVEVTDTEIRTNVYEAEFKTKVSVSGILYDACSQFDDETAQWLELSNKKALTFHPAYLSGFYAEAPDVESSLFSGLTRNYAIQSAATAMAGVSRSGVSMTLPENFTENAELVLMPVWLLASRQGEKMIYTAIRGSDRAEKEKIHCELPVSPKRFILLLCILAALFTALILRLHHYIVLRPQITAALSGVLAVLCWNAAAPFLARAHQRGKDGDPTRRMLGDSGPLNKRNLYDYIPASEQQGEGSSRYTLHGKKLIIGIAVIAAILLLYVITNRNPLRAFNSLISDESALPVMLGIASAVLLTVILFKNRDLSRWNAACIVAQAGICVLSAFCGKQKELLYVFSLAGFVLTLLVMLNAFRHHNEYVTRPVPFFGEEGSNE